MNPVNALCQASKAIDRTIESASRYKLIACTTATVAIGTFFIMRWASRKSWNWESKVKNTLRMVPSINKKLDDEFEKLEKSLEQKYFMNVKAEDICLEVPKKPWDVNRILERLQNVAGNARNGKNTGAYYIDNKELDDLILQVCHLARRTNPLHTELSPLIRQMESEIVRMTLSMFKGDDTTVGNVTSGGTDSIRHAVYTARERAKSLGHGGGWEMVVPSTAHPAFAKAAGEYCIKLKRVKVFPEGHPKAYQANIEAMRKAINRNTILVVGSMPPFPHGIPDDIEGLSNMLKKADPKGRIGLHVDSCLGGFYRSLDGASGLWRRRRNKVWLRCRKGYQHLCRHS